MRVLYIKQGVFAFRSRAVAFLCHRSFRGLSMAERDVDGREYSCSLPALGVARPVESPNVLYYTQ
jgi:hypothetical protein